MTELRFVNEHIDYPLVTRLSPDIMHMSGRTITVYGTLFLQNSTVYVGDFPVSDWDSNETHVYSWKWDNLTKRSVPYQRFEEDPEHLHYPKGTLCKILQHHGLLSGQWQNLFKVRGLLNFTWVSETEMSFVAPCIREEEIGYKTILIELPDGRKSATQADVIDGIIEEEQQDLAELLVVDKCVEPGYVLLLGECRPCPDGAECPPGGRIWPLEDYWNTGEYSGFVQKCAPPFQGKRCLGGKYSKCSKGYKGDHFAIRHIL
jgi:hypothetical protein